VQRKEEDVAAKRKALADEVCLSHTHSLSHTHTHSLSLSLSLSHTHTYTASLSGRRKRMLPPNARPWLTRY